MILFSFSQRFWSPACYQGRRLWWMGWGYTSCPTVERRDWEGTWGVPPSYQLKAPYSSPTTESSSKEHLAIHLVKFRPANLFIVHIALRTFTLFLFSWQKKQCFLFVIIFYLLPVLYYIRKHVLHVRYRYISKSISIGAFLMLSEKEMQGVFWLDICFAACEQIVIRSFPISTLTKEKLVKLQYTPHIDQLPKEGLQLRACIFQVRTPIYYQYWQSAIRSDETNIQIHCYEQADIIQQLLFVLVISKKNCQK